MSDVRLCWWLMCWCLGCARALDVAPSAADDATDVQHSAEAVLNEIVREGLRHSEKLLDVRERELFDAGMFLTKRDPAYFHSVFSRQLPEAKELSRFGFATQKATAMLAKQ